MLRIIGIDPGSRITGYGIVDIDGQRPVYVTSGCIRTEGEFLPDRLKVIFESVLEIVQTYLPTELSIENVFMSKNASSALKLGQARGAAICAGVYQNLPVAEYTPRQIKLAVVGYGAAEKQQVQQMVCAMLGIQGSLQEDAADALAAAICHSHTRQQSSRLMVSQQFARKGLVR